jgi:hypothetical protein
MWGKFRGCYNVGCQEQIKHHPLQFCQTRPLAGRDDNFQDRDVHRYEDCVGVKDFSFIIEAAAHLTALHLIRNLDPKKQEDPLGLTKAQH